MRPRLFGGHASVVLEGKSRGDVVSALIRVTSRIITLCVTRVATSIIGGCRLSRLAIDFMDILFQCIGNLCLLILLGTTIFAVVRVSTLSAISAFIDTTLVSSGLHVSFGTPISTVLENLFGLLSDHFALLGVTAGLI